MMTPTETEPRRSVSTLSSSVLDGHNCVVTGASSGIGREIAIELASAGATVCAVASEGDELEVTATLGRGGGQFELFEADLVDDEQVERAG